MPGQHPGAQRFRGRHRSHDPLRLLVRRAGRFSGGHRSQHDVAAAKQVSPPPLSSGPRHYLRLQQMPAHGPQYAGKTPRLPGHRPTGDHLATRVCPRPRSRSTKLAELETPENWMPLLPHRFLFRIAYPCRYVKAMPREKGDVLLDLPDPCRLDNLAALDEARNFAAVRLAWNELGIGFQSEITGK